MITKEGYLYNSRDIHIIRKRSEEMITKTHSNAADETMSEEKISFSDEYQQQ